MRQLKLSCASQGQCWKICTWLTKCVNDNMKILAEFLEILVVTEHLYSNTFSEETAELS